VSDGGDSAGEGSGDAADADEWEWDTGGTERTDGSDASADEGRRTDGVDESHRSVGTGANRRTGGTDESYPDEMPRGGDDAEPLADLARAVRGRSGRESETAALFESVDVEEVDSEAVWSAISDADSEGLPDVSKPVAGADDGSGAVVPRDTYCGRCEHLDDPPLLACTHEGTDIVAVVDAEHFEVRGCPFVETDDGGPGTNEGLPGRG
jgi:hypothetical protein